MENPKLLVLHEDGAKQCKDRFIQGNVDVLALTGSVAVPTMGPFTAYTATKHAVLGITDGLRRDLKGTGIAVSIICPGLVQTELWNAKRTRQDLDQKGEPTNGEWTGPVT